MQTYNVYRPDDSRASESFVTSESGFSLIELLVVVIIIGILATIAIPTYLGQQEQARSAAVKTDLRNAGTAATLCYAKANGSYAGCGVVSGAGELSFSSATSGGDPDNFGFRSSEGVQFLELDNDDPKSWSIKARYGDEGPPFEYDTISGRVGPA